MDQRLIMRRLNDGSACVALCEHEVGGGRIVAEAQLNAQATLNSLSLEMTQILIPALKAWGRDERVAALLFTGAGERAFCAGGDIQALYRAIVKNQAAGRTVDAYPFDFFANEYRMDHLLHCFPKPTVCMGHGVVMGGGLGIFSACRFRVVTERSRVAYPEVTIGLFPDAGGSWMLRNMALHQAIFLGCTGIHCNGGDALALGIGTHSVANAQRDAVRQALLGIEYVGGAADAERIDAALKSLPAAELPAAQVGAIPDSLSLAGGYSGVVEQLRRLRGDGWLGKGVATMERGCPTTVGVVVEQLRRAPGLNLADCFRMELCIATHCALNQDFPEGVRALLVEKDNQPKWLFGNLDGLDHGHVLKHFEPPWPQSPLHDLEDSA